MAQQTQPAYEETTGWTGWVAFAAVMLMIGGFLQLMTGVIALFNDNWVVWGQEGALFVDLTGWAWAHVLWGLLVILAGVLLMKGSMVGRIIGVIAATISLIINFLFIPVYPFWAITIVVIDALIIWAIMVHGREMKSLS